MKNIILLLLTVFAFSSCEKDDICDSSTATTPRLVIEFYSISNPTTLKNVTSLNVFSPDFVSGLGIAFNGVSKIQVPLKTTTNSTVLHFIQNGADTDLTNNNDDVLTFTYNKQEVFVSRACGYKVLFNLTNSNIDIVTPDSNNWIQNIVIVKPNLESENEVHVKIYF